MKPPTSIARTLARHLFVRRFINPVPKYPLPVRPEPVEGRDWASVRPARTEAGPSGGSSIAHRLCLLACLALPLAAHAQPPQRAHTLHNPDLTPAAAAALRALPTGQRIELRAVPLGADAPQRSADMVLERFTVHTPQARVRIHHEHGEHVRPPAATSYLRGQLHGQPRSRALAAVEPDHSLRLLVDTEAGHSIVHDNTARLTMSTARRADIARNRGAAAFRCNATAHGPTGVAARIAPTGFSGPLGQALGRLPAHAAPQAPAPEVSAGVSPEVSPEAAALATGAYRVASLIVETDHALYRSLGSAEAVERHVTDLTAYLSDIYRSELGVELVIEQLNIYPSAAANPWRATDDYGILQELRNRWSSSARRSQSRSLVVLLAGESLAYDDYSAAGIAYVDALCNADYGYAVLGGVGQGGRFNPGLASVVWDSIGYAHELGHVFGSLHTHEFDLNLGHTLPVDCCDAGDTGYCRTQPLLLPGIGSLQGGSIGQRTGTIMSYCHLLPGGNDNISPVFGQGHPYGIAAQRVPEFMRSTIGRAAARYPQCLPVRQAPQRHTLSVRIEGQGSVLSSPAGLDCRQGTCSHDFDDGSWLLLRATPAAGQRFEGWRGDCAGQSACLLGLTAPRSVTARFAPIDPVAPGGAYACFLDWAGRQFPHLFAPPAGSRSLDDDEWIIRYYATHDAYLGVLKPAHRLYYLGPHSAHRPHDLGDMGSWLALSGCD
ncbi:MAG: M12 family metallo-peptidase [Rhodocyclaceae bacterium]